MYRNMPRPKYHLLSEYSSALLLVLCLLLLLPVAMHATTKTTTTASLHERITNRGNNLVVLHQSKHVKHTALRENCERCHRAKSGIRYPYIASHLISPYITTPTPHRIASSLHLHNAPYEAVGNASASYHLAASE